MHQILQYVKQFNFQIFYFFLIFFSTHIIFAQENETIIEIDQPRFSEKGIGQKAFEIKAKKDLDLKTI